MRRQAFMLVLVAFLGATIFVLTDPVLFPWGAHIGDGTNTNRVDAARRAWPGTVIGLAGCATAGAVGLWLGTRRMG